jgi:hypothetical protein
VWLPQFPSDVVLCIVLLLEHVPCVLCKREWLVYGSVCVYGSILHYATAGEIKDRTLTMFMLCVL